MPSAEKLWQAKMAHAKKMSKKRTLSLSTADPFRLEGRELTRSRIAKSEIPSWYAEMRDTLSKRWVVVESHHREGSLAAELGKTIGKPVSVKEAERWFRNARQDHKWRMRLLNPRTAEGKLYLAYSHLSLENQFFRPNSAKIPEIRELVLFLLDLEQPPHPFWAPILRGHAIKPGDFVERPPAQWEKWGMFMFLPMEGLRIPRRYSKVRACEALTRFLHERSEEYWNHALRHLKSVVTGTMRPYKNIDVKDKELAKNFFGGASMGLVSTLRAPLLRLARSIEPRDPLMTTEEEAEAAALYWKWYPHVKKMLRFRASGRTASGPSVRFTELFNEAYGTERQPQRIALQMVAWHLALPIGIDTLRKRVLRTRRSPRKKI
jgi:hypothetical protein